MTDHVRGDGPVELLMYGDFECPYCRDAAPAVARVLARLEGRVHLRFRHFPIEAKHPHATRAAEAAEAAGAQGRFWEMHDLLFANQKALEDADLAFTGERLEHAKTAVLAAAVLATATSALAFRLLAVLPPALRGRGAVAGELVDLDLPVDPELDHVRGGAGAPVTLVEYGDYQCPYCGRAEAVVRELLAEFGDDLRYVWRHLPLQDVHANAQLAAEAAEAAAAQGRFWEMHDLLIDNQEALRVPDLRAYAQRLGLEEGRFWDDLRGRAFAGRVARDVESADLSRVAGTPTFFVDGRRHVGEYDAAPRRAAVRAARAAARR